MACIDFFKKNKPFSLLPERELLKICDLSKKKTYKKGEFIFQKGDKNLGSLLVLERGLVELNLMKGEKQVILGYRGEGELIGEDVYFSGKPYSYNAFCVEETSVYLIPKTILDEISENHPAIYSHIAKLLSKRVEIFYREAEEIAETKRIPAFFRRKVGEILRKKSVTFVEPQTLVKDLARIMDEKNEEAVVVKDGENIIGIVSEKDIVRRYLAKKLGDKASDIMSPSPVKVGLQDLCYKAAVEMIKNRIRHVLVQEDKRIIGMLNILDLIEDETLLYLRILEDISSAENLDSLSQIAKKIEKVVELLVDSNISAYEICNIVTELNDELTRKCIDLTIKDMEEINLKFSFLVFGSHGRKEQTLKTDQDNGIICEEDYDEGIISKLSESIVENLEKIGFPKCPGDMMVSNPFWRGNLKEWKEKLYKLFINPVPEKILKFSVFFDHRTVWGEPFFENELKAIIREGIKAHPGFLARLAKVAAEKKPPIGLFGRFIVEKSGEHKNELDIKARGCLPIVEGVRVLSLLHNIEKSNTFERVRELKSKGKISPELAEEIEFAYDFLLKLRIKKHLNLYKEGIELHNYINPEHLSSVEKKLLKESFAVIYKLQKEALNQTGAVFLAE